MMRILSIGSDRKLFQQNSALAVRTIEYGKRLGHLSVIVFSLKSHGFASFTLSPEVTVYPTSSRNRFMYIFDAMRIGKEVVRKEKFVRGESVVTCQDPFESGFVGWSIARHFHFPLHLQIHTDFLSPYFKTSFLQKIRVILGRFLLPKAVRVRVVSKQIRDSLRTHGITLRHEPYILPIRITVKPDGKVVKIENFFPQFNFKILMASRLEKEKRITDALDAFAVLVSQFPQAGLLVAGSGTQEAHLRAHAQKLGIQNSVVFVGWVDDVSSYIISSDIFLSTSEYEGYGMSIVEAGLLGIPVVSTSAGIAREVLKDGENSSVCGVGDILCITRSLVELLSHNEKRSLFSMALRSDIVKIIPSSEEYLDMYVKGLTDSLK